MEHTLPAARAANLITRQDLERRELFTEHEYESPVGTIFISSRRDEWEDTDDGSTMYRSMRYEVFAEFQRDVTLRFSSDVYNGKTGWEAGSPDWSWQGKFLRDEKEEWEDVAAIVGLGAEDFAREMVTILNDAIGTDDY